MKIFLLTPSRIDSKPRAEVEAKIQRFLAAFDQSGDQVTVHPLDRDLYARVIAARPDVVFNLASVYQWENTSSVPAILEITAIPYSGAGYFSLSLVRHPTKLIPLFHQAGINLPAFRVVTTTDVSPAQELRFPLHLLRDESLNVTQVVDPLELHRVLSDLSKDEEFVLQECPRAERQSIFLLDGQPLSPSAPSALCSPALIANRLMEARGLTRLEFALEAQPLLMGIDPAPDPFEDECLAAARSAGWSELTFIHMLLEHAARD
jgi:hypothetical protein